MSTLAQSWKAVVAFFVPGLLLLLEPIAVSGEVPDGGELVRALIVAVSTSAVVWLKVNGSSADPRTSTPEPLDDGQTLAGYAALLLVIVVAILLASWLGARL